MGKFYRISFSNEIFQTASIYFLFLLIFGQFLLFGGVGVAPGSTWIFRNSRTSFSLFFNGFVSTNLYSCLSMETLYFLHSLYSLVKLNKWYTFKSYIKERFWFLKKSQIWQKQYVMICYASSGSVLQLLHILSSRFTAILVYVPFLLLPLCDVIYVWFLTVNII